MQLAKGLLAIQKEAAELDLRKDSTNPHFKNNFLSLKGLTDKIVPLLNKHGFVLLQSPSHIAGAQPEPALTTILMHSATGYSVEATMPLVLDKDNPQGQGSAITYARRYALMAMLGLVAEEDDDGQSASQTSRKRQAAPRKRAATTPSTDADGTGAGIL